MVRIALTILAVAVLSSCGPADIVPGDACYDDGASVCHDDWRYDCAHGRWEKSACRHCQMDATHLSCDVTWKGNSNG